MAAKNILPVFQCVNSAAMTGNITSAATDIRGIDNVAYQLQWTGTPTGTFAVQVSSDYVPAPSGASGNAGTWIPLSLSAVISASGSADQAVIDLNNLPAPFVRLVYTFTSGTGTLSAFISGKGL